MVIIVRIATQILVQEVERAFYGTTLAAGPRAGG
jgi:hypothetical protein